MARTVRCPACGLSGQVAPSDGTFDVVLGHRIAGTPIWRCSSCKAGITFGIFSGLLFGNPKPVAADLWQAILRCLDDDWPVPPEIVCTPLSLEPGYAFQWEAGQASAYLNWQRAFGPQGPGHDELAGGRIGSAPDPGIWQNEDGTLGRAVTYAGYKAVQIGRAHV